MLFSLLRQYSLNYGAFSSDFLQLGERTGLLDSRSDVDWGGFFSWLRKKV